MSITRLKIRDWKGETATVDLADLTAFRGRSGSGKTARLAAMMYALMGHCGDGKRNEDIADYAGPNGTTVGLEFDDGYAFERGIKAVDGGWAESIAIAGTKKMGVEKARGDIRNRFGDFSVALNPDEIVAMKPEASRDFILDLCQSKNEYDAETICRLILLAMLYAHPNVGEATAKIFLEYECTATPESCTLADIDQLAMRQLGEREHSAFEVIHANVLSAMQAQGDGSNERISAALESVEEFVRLAKSAEKESRQAGNALSEKKNATPIVAGDVSKLTGTLTELRAKEVELEKRITSQQESEKHADTIRTQIDGIELELAQAQAAAARQFVPLVDVKAADTERDALAEQADKKLVSDDWFAEELERLTAALQSARDKRAELALIAERRAGIQRQVDELERTVKVSMTAMNGETRTVDELTAAADAIRAAMPDTEEMIKNRDRIKADIAAATEQQRRTDMRRNEAQSALALSERIATANQATLDAINSSPAIKMHDAICEQCKASTAGLIADETARRIELTGLMVECRADVVSDCYTLSAIESEAVAIREKIAWLESDRAKLQSAIDEALRQRDESSGKINAINRLTWDRQEHDRLLARRDHAIAQLAEFPADIDAQITSIDAEIATALADIEKAKTDRAAVRDEIESIKSKLKDLSDAVTQEREAESNHAKAVSEANASVARLATELDDAKSSLDKVIAESPNLTIQSMQTELAGVRDQIVTTEKWLADKRAYLKLDSDYNEMIAKAEAKRTEHEIGTMAVTAIKQVREHLMVELTKPVTARMTEFLEAYEPGMEAFITLTKGTGKGGSVFKLGWIRNGRKVSIKTVAGGERVVIIAALAYAVTMIKDPPLKLMLVDACTATPDILRKLIKALEWAAGHFDNVVMAVHPTVQPSDFSDAWLVSEVDSSTRANVDVPADAETQQESETGAAA